MNGLNMDDSRPDWQLRLERDGFAVVPNRVSPEDCADFREQALSWLEGFPYGFRRDDRSTWTSEHLPYSVTSDKASPIHPSQVTQRSLYADEPAQRWALQPLLDRPRGIRVENQIVSFGRCGLTQ